ncbi:MAG: hypothetical protein IKL17_03090 [Alistipes sp.]|nr:hypothetical protein [Alistipes sp.]
MLRFSLNRIFKTPPLYEFLYSRDVWLFWHLLGRENAHIRQVCCGFSCLRAASK